MYTFMYMYLYVFILKYVMCIPNNTQLIYLFVYYILILIYL
jgi:hypothetical protein